MSVINKMLRDLDHRQPPAAAVGASVPTDALRHRGVASVALRATGPRRGARWGWVILLAAVLAGAGWWQWQQMQGAEPVPPPAPVAVVPPAVAAVPVAAAASSPVAQEVVMDVPPAPPPPSPVALPPSGLRMETALAINPPQPAETVGTNAPKAAVMPPPKPVPSIPSAPVADAPKKLPAAASVPSTPVATPLPATPATDVAGVAQRQQQAARETLAQAQALWNSGARENAIALLQDALAAAERAAQTNAGAANNQTLVSILRELARMELAEGRASTVWDQLSRLEPLMANQPELWALRANAAQRLGRHQDSVLAYTTALQSRPNEQRWLLGAAVSLAALGQTSAAGDMAEKARAVGPVSKEVQIYLRQQGVPLADR